MINLNIQNLDTDKLVTIVPRTYSQEEFLFLLEDRTYDQKFQSFMTFCDESLTQFDVFAMLLQEIYSNEGFLDAAKDVLIRFVKWLWRTLTYLGNKIMELFGFAKKDGNTPEAIASRIMCKESRGIELSKLKRNDTKNLYVSIGLTSEDDISDLNKWCCTVITMIESASALRSEYVTNPLEYLTKIDQTMTDILNLFGFGSSIVEYSTAYDYLCSASEHAIRMRGIASSFSSEMKSLPNINISETSSADDVNKALTKLFEKLDPTGTFLHRHTIEEDMHFFRSHVQLIRMMCAGLYKIERAITKDAVSIVSQISASNGTSPGAVDFITKIPSSLLNRMRTAWNYNFNLDRIIITNCRNVSRFTTAANATQGLIAHSRLLNRTISPQEVFINYNYFRDELQFCKNQREFENMCTLTNNFNNAEAIDVSYNRIDWFLVTLVHECRHLVQLQYQLKYKDTDVDCKNMSDDIRNYEKYLKLGDETDARKAAAAFRQYIIDEARIWVKRVLASCLRLEHRNVLNHMR